MGDHYIPQYYLKGFLTAPREQLWCFDKSNNGEKFLGSIRNIANENRFYSPEVEQYLANTIEGPANLVLQKIRLRHQITDDDKYVLAKYMAVMYRRVPQGKQRLKENSPRICKELLIKFNNRLDLLALEEPIKLPLLRSAELKFRKFLRNILKIHLKKYG